MIAEFKKALEASKHPGMSGHLSLPRLMTQAVPFVTSPRGAARPPLTLYWSINSVCNLHCKMCDVGMANKDSNFFKNLRLDGKLKEVPLDLFRRVVDEVAPYKTMISITATEPLMYKDLAAAVEHARSRELEIAITTGGYLLPKKAQELAEAGLTRLNVSIDGPPGLHNEIRGRKDSFEKSVEGITLFVEACRKLGQKCQVIVNFTMTNLNFHSLVDFYRSLKPYPIDQINFTHMSFVTDAMASDHNRLWGEKYHATSNCIGAESDPGLVDVDVLASQIEALLEEDKGVGKAIVLPRYDREQLRRFYHQPELFMGHQRCMVNWFIGQIIASGDVIPYTRCYQVVLGNIHEQPFMDIWNGERANAWRRDLRQQKRFPACTRCDQAY